MFQFMIFRVQIVHNIMSCIYGDLVWLHLIRFGFNIIIG